MLRICNFLKTLLTSHKSPTMHHENLRPQRESGSWCFPPTYTSKFIPDICHFFYTHTHFKSWKFYTRKMRKFTTKLPKTVFFWFFWNFFTLSQNFYRHGVRSVRDKYQVYGLGLGQDHGLVIFRNTQHWSQNSKQQWLSDQGYLESSQG